MARFSNPNSIRHLIRSLIRLIFFAAVLFLLWRHEDPEPFAGILPRQSAWIALGLLAAKSFTYTALGGVIVLLLSLFFPRPFCRYACPMGTLQSLLAWKRKPLPFLQKMPRLGIWIAGAGLGGAVVGIPLLFWLDPLVMLNATAPLFTPSAVSGWGWVAALAGPVTLLVFFLLSPYFWCTKICPLGATQDLFGRPRTLLRRKKAPPTPEKGGLSRRFWLSFATVGLVQWFLPKKETNTKQRPIRPPSTRSESHFLSACARCGACARACPAGIIQFGGIDRGIASLLAPELSFEHNYCQPSCVSCGKVCPTHAISPFTLSNKFARPIGIARVTEDHCRLASAKECGVCVGSCPNAALDLEWDSYNMVSRVKVKPEVCVGCGACEYNCPSTPRAICVVPTTPPAPNSKSKGHTNHDPQHSK